MRLPRVVRQVGNAGILQLDRLVFTVSHAVDRRRGQADGQEPRPLGFRIARTYRFPYVDRVTMPAPIADWLARRGARNKRLRAEPAIDGLKTWDHRRHGPAPWMQFFYDWRFGDLFGTGELDLLLTCGAFRQAAYKASGELVWQYEDQNAGYMDIRLDSNFPIADIDADGRAEAVLPRKLGDRLHLCVIDAATGQVRQSIPYPGLESRRDLRSSVTVVNTRGTSRPSELLVGWDYSGVFLLDSSLNLLWERDIHQHPQRRHDTMGHTPRAFDLDGDGRDEILAGSTLLSPDGQVLWVAPDLPALMQDGHCDSPLAVDWRGDGHLSLFMSTGGYCFARKATSGAHRPADHDWQLVWSLDGAVSHGQAARVARLLPDVPGQQVVLYDNVNRRFPWRPDVVWALAADGSVLWRREFFGPHMQEGGFGFWVGDWDGDALDEVLVNDLERVHVLRGRTGETLGTLPGHLVYAFDLVGDNRPEAIVVDTLGPEQHLLILENADLHPKNAVVIQRRIADPSMYNCTRY
jgi:hypothetical protein